MSERVQYNVPAAFSLYYLSCLFAPMLALLAPPSSAPRLYDAITVRHDNMHPINRLYAISKPIHSSNVIRLITGWLHKEDDPTADTHTRRRRRVGEGCVKEMMKVHLIRQANSVWWGNQCFLLSMIMIEKTKPSRLKWGSIQCVGCTIFWVTMMDICMWWLLLGLTGWVKQQDKEVTISQTCTEVTRFVIKFSITGSEMTVM